jgi:hypothetical protein
MAERIVAYFDLDALRIIEEEPQRLSEVPCLPACLSRAAKNKRDG